MRTFDALETENLEITLGENFLLLGTDVFLADQVTASIKKKLKAGQSLDLVIIYADEIKAAQLNDLLDSYSIFSDQKLVILKNAESLAKMELDCLASYVVAPSDHQTVVVQSEKIDARLAGWKKIKESCVNILCDPPKHGGNLKPWINKALSAMGKTMTSQAMEVFTARVELDYASTHSELQKLGLLVLDKKQITETDVIRSIGSSRAGTMIDFHRALGGRQLKRSLELMSRMLASDWAALQVFFQIQKFYAFMLQILILKKNNISNAEIMKDHLREAFQSQRPEYVKLSESYSLKQVWKIFAVLVDTDSKIKLSQGSDAMLLTNCLCQIMGIK